MHFCLIAALLKSGGEFWSNPDNTEFSGSVLFSKELMIPFGAKVLQKAAFHPIANNRR
jgi:hypothetical protein